ncbi:MAG: ribosomal protein S12 methylthiotransferase RimO [Isosphaeraceae bacterium]|jgi:ribosomal protein S12 methylthiotransferase|nr:MAG: ribosomal protein S12 methylthiotransferase RimO [Isosphaeraceae bacterium]
MSQYQRAKATYSFVSLGCPKNLVDSERMLGLLAQDGYHLVSEGGPADFVVVNTCGFIDAAREESLAVIREMVERKRRGELKGVVVAGCLAEREKESLLEEVPGIDQVVGVFGREEIARVAERIVGGVEEQRTLFRPAAIRALPDTARLRITPRHLAYLKVSEGCDRLCTFCAIPSMRGKHVTKPIEDVVREARELARDGVRELNLVAQDMTYYGVDLYGRPRLADLLRELDRIEELDWIRILYVYPQYVTDELIETIAASKRIVPYVDMPLQHINDRILKLMNRRHTKPETMELVQRLRAGIPGLVLRTTFIVGFPGETEEEFEELRSFVEEARFERVGVFAYSYEEGTPSARLGGHLPEEEKQARRDRLMEVQRGIAERFNRSLVGRTLDVLIDRSEPGGEGIWAGRSYADAPEVDGQVYVAADDLRPGDLLRCEVVEALEYDLVARPARPRQLRRRRAGVGRSRGGTSLPIVG